MLTVKNLNPFLAKLKRDREKLKSRPQAYVRAAVLKMFKVVLKESPQYSGDFAANWNIETNQTGPHPYFEIGYKGYLEDKILELGPKNPEYLALLKRPGSPEAVNLALSRAMDAISTIKYNTKITFVNRTPIAGEVGKGIVAYRPVNQHLQHVAFVSHLKTISGLKGLR